LPSLGSDSKQSNAEKQQAQALLQKYQQAVQQNPNDSIARTNLGETLRRVGDLAGAQREQEKALQLKPDLQAAKIGLALIQQDQGNADDAKQIISQTLNSDESAAAYFYLDNALYYTKDFNGAEVAYRKALSLSPNNLASHARLAGALREQGKNEEALAELRAVIRLDPSETPTRILLTYILISQGKNEEAIFELREAIRLGSNDLTDSRLHELLGSVLYLQHKREEAFSELKIARDLYEKQGDAEGVKRVREICAIVNCVI
jgi:tetratricopeptide (TPR) repeat protein